LLLVQVVVTGQVAVRVVGAAVLHAQVLAVAVMAVALQMVLITAEAEAAVLVGIQALVVVEH
jgi:hypothetical protein